MSIEIFLVICGFVVALSCFLAIVLPTPNLFGRLPEVSTSTPMPDVKPPKKAECCNNCGYPIGPENHIYDSSRKRLMQTPVNPPKKR